MAVCNILVVFDFLSTIFIKLDVRQSNRTISTNLFVQNSKMLHKQNAQNVKHARNSE